MPAVIAAGGRDMPIVARRDRWNGLSGEAEATECPMI